ncbi:MAG: amidohydrolase, partial [Lentisphaeria bacterium]|nr:amidohydrolase [Lentisphaeria bacterium]
MSRILLKNAILPDGITCADLLIEGNRFAKIGNGFATDGAEVIECSRRYAVLPPFYNGHTHAAMAILRGYADDYDLFDWLSNYIWPLEAKMT